MRRAQSEWEFKYSQEWQSKLTTYESRIRQNNQDREGLEGRLKQTLQENEELRRRLQELGDISRKVAEYENRIALMSHEIERLNGNLRNKVEEISNWDKNYRILQQENENLKRAQGDMEMRIREELKLQTNTYESRFLMVNKENE